MDDVVILSESKDFLHNLLCTIKIYLSVNLKLQLKDNYKIFPVTEGIDFVGFRHFPTYKLLRRSSCQRFKRNLISINKKQDINDREWCSVISECGWLTWCNSYNFFQKYVYPLIGKIGSYYYLNKQGKKNKSFLLFLKYENKYNKNMKNYKHLKSHTPIHKKGGKYALYRSS